MEPIKLFIADDHALFREGIQALLLAAPDIVCVGEAATGQEAVRQVLSLQPDVVLMDINMPDLNGVEATRRILQANLAMGIIMVTMLEDDASVFAAMRAGARGYVLKGSHHSEMLQAIRAVAQGQALFGPAVASRIMRFFQSSSQLVTQSPATAAFPSLTEREREVLALIAQGKNNGEIAQILVISPKTVRNHITNIFDKLQVAGRAEAIIRAREAGMGTSEK
jgi:DNA-binding NarL/FixJ family response regulator